MNTNNQNIFTDKINIFFIFKYLNKKNTLYYIEKNLLSKIINFFFKKKIIQLKWKLYNENVNGINIFTKIFEEKLVDKFVLKFLEKKVNLNPSFLKLNNIDKKYFKDFLILTFTTNKNLINSFSIFNFLIFLDVINKNFEKNNIVFLKQNIFSSFLKEEYSTDKINFEFNKKIINLNIFNFIRFVLSRLKYLLIFTNQNLNSKKVCVMDSYQINEPNVFFNDNELYKNMIFISLNNNPYSAENIFKSVNINVLYKFLKYLRVNYILFKQCKNLFYLFNNYTLDKIIFKNFFENRNIKIFLTSFCSQNFTASAVAAISELNGKSIGFAMSLSYTYKLDLGVDLFDYFFNFSKIDSSNIQYNTKILNYGYLGDYKFENIKNDSLELRKKLQKNGAKFIIGFFDQGSVIDRQFQFGHEIFREGYNFLIKKVIENPELGLIIKPKKPKFLKEKLGPVYALLERAKLTNRCIVFDNYDPNHVKNFIDIPAKIARASDLTIHDHMVSGTAGLESALVGTKSILFDYFKTYKKNIYKKNANIVFTDWNILWDQINLEILNKETYDFGNWEQIIDNFDRYRDGKSNVRVMNFIKKLVKD